MSYPFKGRTGPDSGPASYSQHLPSSSNSTSVHAQLAYGWVYPSSTELSGQQSQGQNVNQNQYDMWDTPQTMGSVYQQLAYQQRSTEMPKTADESAYDSGAAYSVDSKKQFDMAFSAPAISLGTGDRYSQLLEAKMSMLNDGQEGYDSLPSAGGYPTPTPSTTGAYDYPPFGGYPSLGPGSSEPAMSAYPSNTARSTPTMTPPVHNHSRASTSSFTGSYPLQSADTNQYGETPSQGPQFFAPTWQYSVPPPPPPQEHFTADYPVPKSQVTSIDHISSSPHQVEPLVPSPSTQETTYPSAFSRVKVGLNGELHGGQPYISSPIEIPSQNRGYSSTPVQRDYASTATAYPCPSFDQRSLVMPYEIYPQPPSSSLSPSVPRQSQVPIVTSHVQQSPSKSTLSTPAMANPYPAPYIPSSYPQPSSLQASPQTALPQSTQQARPAWATLPPHAQPSIMPWDHTKAAPPQTSTRHDSEHPVPLRLVGTSSDSQSDESRAKAGPKARPGLPAKKFSLSTSVRASTMKKERMPADEHDGTSATGPSKKKRKSNTIDVEPVPTVPSHGAAVTALAPTAAPGKRPIPEKTVIACHHCRLKKLKCDGERPRCYHCSRRGMDDCTYEAVLKRRGPGKHNKEDKEVAKRREPKVKRPKLEESGRDSGSSSMSGQTGLTAAELSDRRESPMTSNGSGNSSEAEQEDGSGRDRAVRVESGRKVKEEDKQGVTQFVVAGSNKVGGFGVGGGFGMGSGSRFELSTARD
ncbi:hypothetical protein IAU60_000313 [Kwoniella sp. DSM 27419]